MEREYWFSMCTLEPVASCKAWNVLKFFSINVRTDFCLKMEPSVLFFRLKQRRMRPSHSLKLIGGSGLRGSIRTTDESTFGGGLKLFLPTWIRQNAPKNIHYSLLKRYRQDQHRGSDVHTIQYKSDVLENRKYKPSRDEIHGPTIACWQRAGKRGSLQVSQPIAGQIPSGTWSLHIWIVDDGIKA